MLDNRNLGPTCTRHVHRRTRYSIAQVEGGWHGGTRGTGGSCDGQGGGSLQGGHARTTHQVSAPVGGVSQELATGLTWSWKVVTDNDINKINLLYARIAEDVELASYMYHFTCLGQIVNVFLHDTTMKKSCTWFWNQLDEKLVLSRNMWFSIAHLNI